MGTKSKQIPLLTKEQVSEQLLQQYLRGWKENVERHQPTAEIKRLKDEIAFLKAEYKAVAGCDIKDEF